MGYAGGTSANPTYYHLGDHTESLEVDFDPKQISYADLLKIYFETGSHRSRPWSVQYKSAIFTHSAEQKAQAEQAFHAAQERAGRQLFVDIVPFQGFTWAEDYHQKYYLRESSLGRELTRIYPDWRDFTNSTAAARLNGYVCGQGRPEDIQANLERLGLSDKGQAELCRRARLVRPTCH